MKTLFIILLTCLCWNAKGQTLDKAINDLIDMRLSVLNKDTILYKGVGIIGDGSRANPLRVDPAYITTVAKKIPIDGYNLIMLLKTVPVYTTTQRSLLKPTEGMVIYNRSTFTYQLFTGGAWK